MGVDHPTCGNRDDPTADGTASGVNQTWGSPYTYSRPMSALAGGWNRKLSHTINYVEPIAAREDPLLICFRWRNAP